MDPKEKFEKIDRVDSLVKEMKDHLEDVSEESGGTLRARITEALHYTNTVEEKVAKASALVE